MSALPRIYIVQASYCRANLRATFMRKEFAYIHPFIRDIDNYPDKAHPVRVGLELHEVQSPGESIRPANMLELALFSVKHAFFFALNGPVMGYDKCLEEMGKEINTPFRVPIADCDDQGRVRLSLTRYDRRIKQKFSLQVVEEMSLHV